MEEIEEIKEILKCELNEAEKKVLHERELNRIRFKNWKSKPENREKHNERMRKVRENERKNYKEMQKILLKI